MKEAVFAGLIGLGVVGYAVPERTAIAASCCKEGSCDKENDFPPCPADEPKPKPQKKAPKPKPKG